nr:Na+/H+ antiporter NhaC family protein [Microbacterium halophytorum]
MSQDSQAVAPGEYTQAMSVKPLKRKVRFVHAVLPMALLLVFITFGMIVGPMVFGLASWPLEFTFLLAALCTILMLFSLGADFATVQDAIVKRTSTAVPAILMLMAIGLLIGSWTASGTIPYLVYYGMQLIDPHWLYLIAFVLTSAFSLATGTSWGSAGTIGVVLVAIGAASDANLGMLAAAVISGAYFGDKMSPLSDTTVMASMGARVPIYDHIRSMVNTTGPAYLAAVIVYVVAGIAAPSRGADVESLIRPTVDALGSSFDLSFVVLAPLVVVVIGAIWRKPPLPTLLISSAVAAIIAVAMQGFTFTDMVTALINGVTNDILPNEITNEAGLAIVERGGLYSMASAVLITLTVFMFIGSMDVIDAVGRIVRTVFAGVRSRPATIIASLVSSSVVNLSTSNQYATAFIVGEVFGPKYDEAGIPRKVLSRSIEDYGTAFEPMVPWTTTGVYMVATLGVAYADYVPYMFMQFGILVMAPLLAITGIGCFYKEARRNATAA